MFRERLPFEDLDKGLYVNPGTKVLTLDLTKMHQVDGVTVEDVRYYVEVEEFMAVQKERDDYRRALGLINACRANPELPRLPDVVVRLLEGVGFDAGQAKATVGIIREVLSSQ